jgi:hypothetical protein
MPTPGLDAEGVTPELLLFLNLEFFFMFFFVCLFCSLFVCPKPLPVGFFGVLLFLFLFSLFLCFVSFTIVS